MLSKEQQNEWDMMFLHYLGLDHIGHSFGPKSLLVAEKLDEMDKIIKRIHDETISEKVWRWKIQMQ